MMNPFSVIGHQSLVLKACGHLCDKLFQVSQLSQVHPRLRAVSLLKAGKERAIAPFGPVGRRAARTIERPCSTDFAQSHDGPPFEGAEECQSIPLKLRPAWAGVASQPPAQTTANVMMV